MPSTARDVYSSECRVTRDRLITSGASTCVVLAAVNTEAGKGLLGHLTHDDLIQGELLEDAVLAIPALGPGESTRIRLAGGGIYFSDGEAYPEGEQYNEAVRQRVFAMAEQHGIPLANITVAWLDGKDEASVEVDAQKGTITVKEEINRFGDEFYEPKYFILENAEQREELVQRTLELVKKLRDDEIDTVVWLDRAARPFSWFAEAIWQQESPDLPIPKFIYLNIGGEKNLRESYMPDSGIYDNNGAFHQQFAGIFEPEDKLALFEQRIREDENAQHQLVEELGPEAAQDFTGKKVLIVDHLEFEGVSRLFTEYVIDETYSPQSINYFEFGQECGGMPTGLENPDNDPSFLATESEDPDELRLVLTLKRELAHLARSVQPS